MHEASEGPPPQSFRGEGPPEPDPQLAARGHSLPHPAPHCLTWFAQQSFLLPNRGLNLCYGERSCRCRTQSRPQRGPREPGSAGGEAGGGRSSPKSMRSLWFLCSRARSSCLRGAEVSRGMLRRHTGRRQPGQVLREGPGWGWGTYMGTRVLFFS